MDARGPGRVFLSVMPLADETAIVEVPGPSSFDAFFHREYGPVVALVQALTSSRALAEDITQEAFASAHSRWSRVSGYDRPDLWVRRVAMNRAIGVHRRSRAEQRALERLKHHGVAMLVGVDDAVTPDAAVWQAVQRLPRRQAQLVALVYVEDRSIEDAAAALGVSASTARTHLQRARATLAGALTDSTDRTDEGAL